VLPLSNFINARTVPEKRKPLRLEEHGINCLYDFFKCKTVDNEKEFKNKNHNNLNDFLKFSPFFSFF
jgi:hypothetical protein